MPCAAVWLLQPISEAPETSHVTSAMAGRDEYDPWFDQITLGIREEPAEAGKAGS